VRYYVQSKCIGKQNMDVNYPLYNLNDKELESLSALICERILGTGVIVFSDGKDGGRDAKFTGTANNFPSKASPWIGKVIIQAKHTTNPTASCSDSSFKTILKKEVGSIKKLKDDKKIDFYLLFTNRKLSGLQDPKIEDLIEEEVGVPSCIIGLERMQLWLRAYPDISKVLELNKLLMPLEFYEQDIQDLVIAFSSSLTGATQKRIKDIRKELTRIPIEEKNTINNFGKEYFDNVLIKSTSYFNEIKLFLEDPKNDDYKLMYENTVDDLQEEIVIKRNEYAAFEEILSHLYKIILDSKNNDLMKNRKNIRVFLHYMYFNCDIGLKELANDKT